GPAEGPAAVVVPVSPGPPDAAPAVLPVPDANPRPLEPALRLLDPPPARGTAIQTMSAMTTTTPPTAADCLPADARRHHSRNSRNGVVAVIPSIRLFPLS